MTLFDRCPSLSRTVIPLAIVGHALPVSADPTIQDIAPAHAAFVLGVTNVGDLRSTLEDSSLGDLFNEPEMRPFVSSFTEALLDEMRDGMSEADLDFGPDDLSWPEGAAGIAISFNPDYFGAPTILLMADFGSEKDAMEEIITTVIDKAVDENKSQLYETDYHGTTIFHLTGILEDPTDEELAFRGDDYEAPEPAEEYYAWADSTLLFATVEQQMLDALDVFNNGSDDMLTSSDRYVDSMSHHADDAPVIMYANLGEVFDEFLASMPGDIVDSIGIGSLTSISMSLGFDTQDGLMTSNIFAQSSNPMGVVALFGTDDFSFEPPVFVGADAQSVTAFSFDLPGLADVVETVAENFFMMMSNDAQQASMATQQMMGIAGPAFESLGDHVIFAAHPGIDFEGDRVPMNIVAIPVTDEDIITNLLNLGAGQGVMTARDFEGGLIYEMQAEAQLGVEDFAIGLGHGYLFLGIGEQIENSIRRLANPDAFTLANEPEFERAIATLAPRAIGFSYTDTNAQMRTGLDLLKSSLDGLDDPMFGEMDESAQRWQAVMKKIPDAELFEKYFGASVSEATSDDDGFAFKSVLLGADR